MKTKSAKRNRALTVAIVLALIIILWIVYGLYRRGYFQSLMGEKYRIERTF